MFDIWNTEKHTLFEMWSRLENKSYRLKMFQTQIVEGLWQNYPLFNKPWIVDLQRELDIYGEWWGIVNRI